MPQVGIQRRVIGALALVLGLYGGAASSRGQTVEEEIKALRQELEQLRQSEAEKQRQLENLQRRLEQIERQPAARPPEPTPAVAAPQPPPAEDEAASALDRAIEDLGTSAQLSDTQIADLWSRPVGPATLRLIDISFDLLVAAGTSTATDSELQFLEGGAHDPKRRGFTLQQGELGLAGAVDPYFRGDAFIVFTPSSVELEEAYMTSLSLPYHLQAKAGFFFTEFGIINPLHPHAWDWLDQPVINTRMFGGEGLRTTGGRLSWLAPVPWYSEILGALMNADEGEFTTSFISDEGVGERPAVARSIANLGDLLYLARWENFADLTGNLGARLGFSFLHGPNNTGSTGQTFIYGTDLKVRWRPANHFRGWPFLIWQTEAMKRDYTASFFVAGAQPEPDDSGHGHSHGGGGDGDDDDDDVPEKLAGAILRDYGFYTQLLYGFRYGWAVGTRFEYATGHGQSVGGRANDPFRADRFRFSPLLVWQPTEFSRFRLQYNFDHTTALPGNGDASSVWIGGEILYGAHPAHRY